MFYDVDILGLDLYEVFFTLGLISALVVLRIYGDKKNMPAKVLNFYLISGVAAIIGGYFSSIFFQAIYNAIETGYFVINSDTGMTFLGGLIGGIIVFVMIYLIIGKYLFKEQEHKKYFKMLINIAPCCITIAHFFGRLGCFSVGCCYGKTTTSFLGMHFNYLGDHAPHAGVKNFPVQLWEAIFLLLLFIGLSYMFFKDKWYTMPTYLVGYGIWRFFIEFLRGDDRGGFFIKGLSPSQGTSILMVIIGLVWFGYEIYKYKKLKKE